MTINYDYLARLYFEDECPRLGCGWREVMVKEGDKWATLTECATGKRQRISVDLLDKIESTTVNSAHSYNKGRAA